MGRRAKTPTERLESTLWHGRMFYTFRQVAPGKVVFVPERDLHVGRTILQDGVEEIERGAVIDADELVDEIVHTVGTLTAAAAHRGPHAVHDHHLLNRLVRALRARPTPLPEAIERSLVEAEALPPFDIVALPTGGAVIEARCRFTGRQGRFRVSSTFFGKRLEDRGVLARPLDWVPDEEAPEEQFIAQAAIIRVIDDPQGR